MNLPGFNCWNVLREILHLLAIVELLQSASQYSWEFFLNFFWQMDALRHQTDAERKERARAAFKVSENIAQEREGIVHQVQTSSIYRLLHFNS